MAKTLKVASIISVVIGLILMGVLLPIGLEDLVAYNGSYYTNATTRAIVGTNSTMATLVSVVLPIMGVIGLIMAVINYNNLK